MVYKIFLILIIFLHFVGCTPTNEGLTELTGGDSSTKTKVVPSDLGNQAFTFTPASYDFGNRAVNSATVFTTVSIKNTSEHSIFLSGISGLSGAFALVSDNCPRSPNKMTSGQTCSATVSFAPVAGGIFNQGLTMNYGVSASVNNSYTATMTITGTGVGTLSFAGISSVTNIYSTQYQLNWTHVAGALMYYVFRVNADGSNTLVTNITPPTSTYIVTGLTANTSYKYWVRATDTLGAFDANVNQVTTSTNNTAPAPVLNTLPLYNFTSMGAIALGSTMTLDLNDVRTGVATDSGVTYSCAFDQLADSAVSASNNCSSLPGTFSFSTTSGALSWTPTTQASIGFYEFRLRVTDNTSALTGQAIFVVDIKPAYTTTNLVGNYSANFSSGYASQAAVNIWQDLTSYNFDGTLTNITHNGTTGWIGTGTTASPYRLNLDGTNDYVDFSTLANTATSMTLETWAKPAQLSTNPTGVIISNADSTGKGLMIREAKGYRNRVEAVLGDTAYGDVILADSPTNYLRMGETSGQAIYDAGTTPVVWTPKNLTNGYDKQGIANSSDKGFQFSGNFTCLKSAATIDPATWNGITYEAHVNFTTTGGIQNLISHAGEAATTSFVEWYYTAGYLTFAYSNGASTAGKYYAITPTVGTWYHFIVTVNFTTGKYNLFVNGVNVVVDQAITFYYANWPLKYVVVGCYADQVQWPVNGYMDEVAVYNGALSATRALAHYNAKANYYSCLSSPVDTSKWNHLAATYDQATTRLKLYTNGNNDCNITSSAITLNGSSAQMSVGAKVPAVNSPTAGTFFNGEVTDARVYSSALTTTDVAINMMAQTDKFDVVNSVAGLNLWLKADAITGKNNGDPVSTWSDSSTVGRHATSAATKEPLYIANAINGKPALRFDGVNDSMNITDLSTSWTVIFVGKQITSPGAYSQYISGTELFRYSGTSQGSVNPLQWYMYAPGWGSWQTVAASPGTSYHIHTYRGTTALFESFFDGAPAFSYPAAGGSYAAGYINTIGNYFSDAAARWLNGEIAEVIAYSGTLTEAERKRIEGYLKAKYGL